MKKTVSMILALAMILALSLGAAETVAVDEALLGTWVMDGIEAEFTFLADGTYTESLFGMEGGGVYRVADGKIFIDDAAPMEYLADEETLIFVDNGEEVTFTRKSGETKAQAGGDVYGTWILTGTSLGLTLDMTLVINEDGTYVMSAAGQEQSGNVTIEDGAFRFDEMDPEPYTLEGDILTVEETGVTLTFVREGAAPAGTADPEALIGAWVMESADITITFNADGTMVMALGEDETEGEYTVTGDVITIDGEEEMIFSISGDTLSLTEAGLTLTLVRK